MVGNSHSKTFTFSLFILSIVGKTFSAGQDDPISQNLTFRIIGGGPIDIKDCPFLVSILKGEKHHCGGSIIAHQFILTAAHCTFETPATKFTVRAGSNYWNRGGRLMSVALKVEHPSYINQIFHNDVAILKLDEPLDYGEFVQPISLPDATATLPPPGTMATIYGWGRLDYGVNAMSDMIMSTHVPLVSKESCEKSYSSSIISFSMFCAGYTDGGRDACIGDSGGPLTIKGTQFGIVSWGVSCAAPDSPGVYAAVLSLKDFIYRSTNSDIKLTISVN